MWAIFFGWSSIFSILLFNFFCMFAGLLCSRIVKRKFSLLIWDISSFIMYTFSYKLSSQYWRSCVPQILTFYIFIFIRFTVCFKISLKTSCLIHGRAIGSTLYSFQVFGKFSLTFIFWFLVWIHCGCWTYSEWFQLL